MHRWFWKWPLFWSLCFMSNFMQMCSAGRRFCMMKCAQPRAGKLHSFEINGTQDLSKHRKGYGWHRNQITARHTRRCLKTPSRRASHWLPGTVERCYSTEEALHCGARYHGATRHQHGGWGGTNWGLDRPPPACTKRWTCDIDAQNGSIGQYDFDSHIYRSVLHTSIWQWAKHTMDDAVSIKCYFNNGGKTLYSDFCKRASHGRWALKCNSLKWHILFIITPTAWNTD